MAGKAVTLGTTATLAWAGFGAWSLVWGAAAGAAASLIVIAAKSTRWPRWRFDLDLLRPLLSFGAKHGLEMILWGVTARLFHVLFGYFHGAAALGYLTFAQRLVDEIANLIQGFVTRFGLAVFASIERSGGDAGPPFQAGTRCITVLAAPVFAGLALIAPQLVGTLLDPSWAPSVPIVQIFAIAWMLAFPRVLVGPLLRAKGHQGALTGYAAAACAVTLAACVLTAGQALAVAALAAVARHLIGIPWSVVMIRRVAGLDLRAQLGVLLKPALLTCGMAAAVLIAGDIGRALPAPVRLAAMVGIGASTYVTLLLLLDRSVVGLLLAGLRRPAPPATT